MPFYDAILWRQGTGVYHAENVKREQIVMPNADAAVVIQAACDYLSTQDASTSSGLMWFKPARYTCNSQVTIPKDAAITFASPSFPKQTSGFKGGAIIEAGAAMTSLLDISGEASASANADLSHGIHFRNLMLRGADLVTNVVRCFNTDTVSFDRCRITDGTNAVNALYTGDDPPTSTSVPGGLVMSDCLVESGDGGYGVVLSEQTQCEIRGTRFNSANAATSKHIFVDRCTKIRIDNNEFNNCLSAIFLDDDANEPTQDIAISNNLVNIGSGKKFIEDSLTNSSSYNIRYSGNGNILQTGVITDSISRNFYGTGSILNGTTSIVITHNQGFAYPLGCILITLGENPTNTPGAIWVDTITTNAFTVNCENDPGASNLDFGWSFNF